MKTTTNRLDELRALVYDTILEYQNPITGLIQSGVNDDHAVVRDNLYAVTACWALSLAYKKASNLDEDRAKCFELEHAAIKCMRGLLFSMIRQKDKIEAFQESSSPKDAIHAKFSASTGLPAVGDADWGHLQLDSISLYLLTLAQITSSGLQVIFTLEEVSVIQNLVFYVEVAYCTPDFGVWGRGDKMNTGIPELNASSIGMTKAALEAMTDLDCFGAQGGSVSQIHVSTDETQKNKAILNSMLPRESMSKELDSALLTVIGYPAFAVESSQVIETTMKSIQEKLGNGSYGFKRFLRDGYKTPLEDPTRLHYESWELRVFERIECQWPLFYSYMIINGVYNNDENLSSYYERLLNRVLIVRDVDGHEIVPEQYVLTSESLEEERRVPGSQLRFPSGHTPYLWAQSLHILSRLLREKFIVCGEIDPLNRRIKVLPKPNIIVQVVVLCKNKKIQSLLAENDIQVRTIDEIAPGYEVHTAKVLSYFYRFLGRCKKLQFKGRKLIRDIGILMTSKLYRIQDKIFAFTPQRLDVSANYMDSDTSLMMTTLEYTLSYLSSCWASLGRPLLTINLTDNVLEKDGRISECVIKTLRKLKSGVFVNGTRVKMGNFEDFSSTSCITNLDFVGLSEDGTYSRFNDRVEETLTNKVSAPLSLNIFTTTSSLKKRRENKGEERKRKSSMRGNVRRSRSSNISSEPETLIPSRFLNRLDSMIDIEEKERPFSGDHRLKLSNYRQKVLSESTFCEHEATDLLNILTESETLDEQGDILHYLATTYGLDYDMGITQNDKPVYIRDLLNAFYDSAIAKRSWGMVRHSAGLLGKRVEDISKAVTDLLVRQKQVLVGLPPQNEITIFRPLSSSELRVLIMEAFHGDASTAMLVQELLCYLAMFINTEPMIFHGILRLRIGLIIQVLVSELGNYLEISEDAAYEELMNLSPYEMRNLLHHIMASKDFVIKKKDTFYVIEGIDNSRLSQGLLQQASFIQQGGGGYEIITEEEKTSSSRDEVGEWIRRRRLDGSLSRLPIGFYQKIWHLLQLCTSLNIGNKNSLSNSITQEMTSGELKFACAVESFLNSVQFPEYRQLIVEALVILTLLAEKKIVESLDDVIDLEVIVHTAHKIFLKDQLEMEGDSLLCCAWNLDSINSSTSTYCHGTHGICRNFLDTAPSGHFGTMQYLIKSICKTLNAIPQNGIIECSTM